MKKRLKICLALAMSACILSTAAFFTACGEEEQPVVNNGSSSTLVTDKAPDELTPENAIYAFLQKQSELQSYVITTEGEAIADIAGYKQEIHNTTYKNGSDFLNQAQSDSMLVKMKHQSFSKDGKVVYRDSFDGELSVAEKSDYVKVYGFTADDVTLGGYIINAKTLRYATLEKTEGDTLTYYMRLAGDRSLTSGTATESATTGVALQSKAYGGLDNLPAFSDVDIHLTVKKDWTPVSYSSECSYDCKKVLNMSITQTLECTYSKVNETVEIPNVAEFNEKIGSTPSVVTPSQGESDKLMELAAAFADSLDAENSLTLPVSIILSTFETPLSLGGELALKFDQNALKSGSVADAFKVRFDLDLSALPLLPQVANTLTVRYLGDGVLLVMLNNRVDGKDHCLYTYPVPLQDMLPEGGIGSLEDLRAQLGALLALEETDTGYSLSLKPTVLNALHSAYIGLLASADEALGNSGILMSMLGSTFKDATLTLSTKTEHDVKKITGVAFTLTGTPAENLTKGRKIDISLDIGILSSSGMLTGSFDGNLQLRLNPAALLSGNYFAIAEALLRLDLSPVVAVLGTVTAFAPAGSLPAFVGPAMKYLDVCYTGDGILTLAIKNEKDQPLFVTQTDLKTIELPAVGSALGETPAESETTPLSLLSEFRFEKTADGFVFALGDPAVQAIDTAYQGLVEKLVELITASAGDMGSMAGMLIGNMLGATITDVEFVLGRTDAGKLFFDFAIKGHPAFSLGASDEAIRLYSLTVTDNAPLTDEERTALSESKRTTESLVAQLAADTKTAEENMAALQTLIDEMDLGASGRDAYVAKVNAFKEKFDKLPANVQTLMTNASYMTDMQYDKNGTTYPTLLVNQMAYCTRVDAFLDLLPDGDDYTDFADWDAINALYDMSIGYPIPSGTLVTIPAVKDNLPMQKAIGEAHMNAYKAARDAHETELIEALNANIAASKAKYESATDHNELKEALTELMTNFRVTYGKLPEDKKALVEGYDEYVKLIYMKNIDAVMAVYNDLETKLDTQEVTIENLLTFAKEFSDARTWGFGRDYWYKPTGTMQPWRSWFSALKPSTLSKEEQERVTALNTLNRSFVQGDIAKAVIEKYGDVIKTAVTALKDEIGGCKVVTDGKTTWNFESVSDKAATLERLHGLRYLLACMLPISDVDTLWGDDADLKAFADGLKNYESELAKVVE